eukprot:EG_transcript_8016
MEDPPGVPHISWDMVNRFRAYTEPVTVEVAHSGLERTHPSVVQEQLAMVGTATSVQEYLDLADEAIAQWSHLGIFRSISFDVNPHSDPAVAKGFRAVAHFEENLGWSAAARLHLHKESFLPYIQLSWDNVFGRAWSSQVFAGGAGPGRQLGGLRWGTRSGWMGLEWWLALWQRLRPPADHALGCAERALQLQYYVTTPYIDGWGHQVSVGLEHRQLQPPEGLDLRRVGELARSLKGYVRHILHYDTVMEMVNPVAEDFGMPVGGSAMELDSEYAVVSGDDQIHQFSKHELRSSWYIPLFSDPQWNVTIHPEKGAAAPPNTSAPDGALQDVTVTVEQPRHYAVLGLFLRLGYILSSRGIVPHDERLFLTNNSVRGYGVIGPGSPNAPREGEEAPALEPHPVTGGNVLAAVTADLSMPLPDLLPDGLTFAHCFWNAGNVDFVPDRAQQTPRWLLDFLRTSKGSVGFGFVFGYLPLLGHLGRVEANVSWPLDLLGRPYKPADSAVFQRYKLGLTWSSSGSVNLYPSHQ